jgi:hypothetical protein
VGIQSRCIHLPGLLVEDIRMGDTKAVYTESAACVEGLVLGLPSQGRQLPNYREGYLSGVYQAGTSTNKRI